MPAPAFANRGLREIFSSPTTARHGVCQKYQNSLLTAHVPKNTATKTKSIEVKIR